MTDIVVSSGQTSSGNTLGSGTDMFVQSGGSAVSITVDSGADLTVSAGGTADDVTVHAGADMFVAGLAHALHVEGGAVFVSGGIASDTTIDSGGTMYCLTGGLADGVNIGSQGALYVSSGAIASNTSVTSAGSLWAYSGATIVSGTVAQGGFAIVSGGVTSDLNLLTSGGEYIYSGGSAVFTQVSVGGLEYVYSGGVAAQGAISSGGAAYVSYGGLALDETLLSGGALYVYSAGSAASTTVESGASLYLYSASRVTDTNLAQGATLDLAWLGYDSAGTANLNSADDVLTIVESGTTLTLQLAGNYTGEFFHLGADDGPGTDVTVNDIPCFCAGTHIRTPSGDVAVENLRPGDRLMTLAGTSRKLRWIGQRTYSARFATRNRHILPVCIRRHALGNGVPARDLFISPLHALYFDMPGSGVLVPAGALLNGISIVTAQPAETIAYFHLELETHDVILAEGAAAESFLNDGCLGMFANAADRPPHDQDHAAPPRYYAPRVEDGPVLHAIKRRLNARARRDTAA
jgi:autotransporter passenger strand-loop-strand repeat protein